MLFWTARKASLATMKAVSECCPLHWPKLFVGVGVNGREDYLQDGQQLAHDLDSAFIHIQPENTDHRGTFAEQWSYKIKSVKFERPTSKEC